MECYMTITCSQIIYSSSPSKFIMKKKQSQGPRLTKNEYYPPIGIDTKHEILNPDNSIGFELRSSPFSQPRGWRDRFLIGTEFSRVENKRISDVFEWHKVYSTARNQKKMEEVTVYTVEAKFAPSEQNQFKRWGYFPIGLSAVKLSAHCFVNALVPRGIPVPSYSRLIRIHTSQKTHRILDPKTGIVIPFLIIEAWENVPETSIYRDFPYEKGLMKKLLNFYAESQIIDGIVAPIVSSPQTGGIGGISLSSFAGQRAFTKELLKMVQQLTPPPYRLYRPPAQIETGYLDEIEKGMKYRFADRPYQDEGIVNSVQSTQYYQIANYIIERGKWKMPEYSIFSTLMHPYEDPQGALYELLSHYSDSEITIADDLDNLPEGGANIKRMKNEITEEVYFEVINKRNISPIPTENNQFIIGQVENLKQHYQILLEEQLGKKYSYMADEFLPRIARKVNDNYSRVAQLLARNGENQQIDDETFYSARKIMSKQYEQLVQGVHVRDMIDNIMQDCEGDARHLSSQEKKITHSIMNFLKDDPRSPFDEIHDGIHYESISPDSDKLEQLLDKLEKLGKVIYYESTNTYSWV